LVSEKSRANRVGLGISASVMAQAIQAVQAIVMVPFFIRAWGVDGYGRWITLTAMASYLFLFELGGQNYVTNLITIEYSRGNFEAVRARLGEALSFFLTLGIGIFVAFVAALVVGCRTDVPLLGRPLTSSEAWVLALLAAHTLVLAVPGGLVVTIYRAAGKYARGTMMGNGFRAFGILLGIGLLLAKSSLEVYAASTLVVGLLLTLTLIWDSLRIVPEIRGLKLGWRQAAVGAGLLRGSLPFFMMGLVQTTAPQLLTTFLAIYRTPTEVGIFATHRTLASVPNYIGPLVQGPMLPEMSTLYGQGRNEELKRMAMTAVRTVMFLTGAVALAVWVAGPLAFRLWTRRAIALEPLLLGLLLIQGFLSAAWSTCSWGPLAANHHRVIAALSMAAWLATVGSALLVLVPRWGTTGAAVSILVGDVLFRVLGFPLAAASFYKASPGLVYRHALRGSAYLIPFALLVVGVKLLGGGTLLTVACVALIGVLTLPMMMLTMRVVRRTDPGVAAAGEGPPT
jgi:O-antigen/teichoic acid export membrane protein